MADNKTSIPKKSASYPRRRLSSILEKLQHLNSASKGTMVAIAGVLTSFITAIATVASLAPAFTQNVLYEHYERLDTYDSALDCKISFSDETTSITAVPQIEGAEYIELEGPAIDLTPRIGSISKAAGIVYANETVAAVLALDSLERLDLRLDAHETFLRLSNYSVPVFRSDDPSEPPFGMLFLIVQDHMGNYYTAMISFEFSSDLREILNHEIYSGWQVLYSENSQEFNRGNLGTIPAIQFEEYKKFLDMVRAYTPNGMLH